MFTPEMAWSWTKCRHSSNNLRKQHKESHAGDEQSSPALHFARVGQTLLSVAFDFHLKEGTQRDRRNLLLTACSNHSFSVRPA
jgi:hypothetical protein